MFADDTSVFSKVKNFQYPSLILTITWKKQINGLINEKCYLIKQATEMLFSRKII